MNDPLDRPRLLDGSGGGSYLYLITDPTFQLLSNLRITATPQELGLNNLGGMLKDAQTANWVFNGVGLAASLVNMGIQAWQQNKMADLQWDYQQKMWQLQDKSLDLQETLAEIQERILTDKNDLVRDLAKIEADVQKYQAKMEKEKSVENTKTAARYGYLNDRFYGKPAFSL